MRRRGGPRRRGIRCGRSSGRAAGEAARPDGRDRRPVVQSAGGPPGGAGWTGRRGWTVGRRCWCACRRSVDGRGGGGRGVSRAAARSGAGCARPLPSRAESKQVGQGVTGQLAPPGKVGAVHHGADGTRVGTPARRGPPRAAARISVHRNGLSAPSIATIHVHHRHVRRLAGETEPAAGTGHRLENAEPGSGPGGHLVRYAGGSSNHSASRAAGIGCSPPIQARVRQQCSPHSTCWLVRTPG